MGEQHKRQKGHVRTRLVFDIIAAVILIALGLFVYFTTGWKEAGVRSHLSGVKAKHKELADAIEAYFKQHNKLPFGEEGVYPQLFHIPEGFKETFAHSDGRPFDPFQDNKQRFYFAIVKPDFWLLISPGPDRKMDVNLTLLQQWSKLDYPEPFKEITKSSYDPTNGILSGGDIIRLGP